MRHIAKNPDHETAGQAMIHMLQESERAGTVEDAVNEGKNSRD
jgi:hypothetical protein